MVFRRSAFLIGLVKWALHPASRLLATASGCGKPVSAMIGVGGILFSFSDCLRALVPAETSITGTHISVITRSYRWALNFSTLMAAFSAGSTRQAAACR